MKHAVLIVTLGLVLAIPSAVRSASHATAPAGPTAISLGSAVELAWTPVASATGYVVLRGTSPTTITTVLTPAGGVSGTTFTDGTAVNGTTYYYAVRSIVGGSQSASSVTVQARPVARACSTGNAVVLENCYPGNTGWDVRSTATVAAGGIEGFGTSPSIDKGQSVNLKVNAADASSFRIEIFRMGYYGGSGARLFSVVRGVPGIRQPSCVTDADTGLLDCSNWSVSATITTTSSWPSGVFLLRLVREDTGADNHILLTVRDDARSSQVLYGTGDVNFQAYNNYGGKSLYDFNSIGSTTVAGTPRAVKVSFDRPYEQPRSGLRDWFTRTEYATINWLEREGYDVAYQSNMDLQRNPALVRNHRAYISPAHDEYYSQEMRSALESARGAGVSLFFTGSNELYWKIRFEDSPVNGGAGRVQVNYKTSQSGPPDPSGIPTTTWRDPAGANNPENALTGIMYVGDNDRTYFPLRVSAAEGTDRIWRNTGLDTQPPGTYTDIGTNLVGWEWDARVANGFEPAGLKTLASSPATGQLVQDSGRSYIPGSAISTMVKYTHASGALVVTTGINHWNRGLALNAAGVGEPERRIQQATTNILADMNACPATPASDIVLDNCSTVVRPPAPGGVAAAALGTDSVQISWNAVAGAAGYNVYRSLAPRQGGQPLGTVANGSLVTGTSFTDSALSAATTYYYVVTAVVGGTQSAASTEAAATTPAGAGTPTRLDSGSGSDYSSTSGALFRADAFFTSGGTFTAPGRTITGTSDPALYRSERWGTFTYAIPVVPGTYDVRFHFAELYWGTSVPGGVGSRIFGMDIVDTGLNPDLANIDITARVGRNAALVLTVPDVQVSDGTLNIRSVNGSADDPTVAAIEVIPKLVASPPPTVTDTLPLAGASGVSRAAHATAVFSRAMDAATITGTSFTLARPGGTLVAAAVSYDQSTQTATLIPAAPLDFSTTYTAQLDTTVRAVDGTALTAPVSWSFTTQAPIPPEVTTTSPAAGDTNVGASARPRATFTRSLDPATVTSTSFSLSGAGGAAVPASVAYDDSTRTATLTPAAALEFGTTYTVRLETSITAVDGVPLASPVSWSFTTAAAPPPAPTVASTVPAADATAVARGAVVEATFSRAMDPATLSATSFTLNSPSASVPAAVTYDAATLTARLTPSAALDFATTYTARLDQSVLAADGTALAAAVSWSFTTLDAPPPPAVTAVTPADGATFVARSSTLTASFSRSMDPTSITGSSFTLRSASGAAVAAAVAYDASARVATLTPSQLLAGGGTYTATISTGARSAEDIALPAPVSWSFTTAACPCKLFADTAAPSRQNLPTRDGRSGTGPWSYELGMKFQVDQPMQLTAIRYFRNSLETGSHVGRVWTAGGSLLASAAFTAETAAGWQQQGLASPVSLQPGTTYLVSVNANAYFGSTASGLATAVVSGPLASVADGQNGVYGDSAGTFPTRFYQSSNYFVDFEAVPEGDPAPPAVIATTPLAGATDVPGTTVVAATFSRPIDPATLTSTSFFLTSAGGGAVPAAISWDEATRTARLTPASPLAAGGTYVATVTQAVRGTEGKPMAAATTWSFGVRPPVPLQVTSTQPAGGAADELPGVLPRATFSRALDPATVNGSTVTLTGPGGAAVAASVAYDAASTSAVLTPNAALAPGAYTMRIDAAVSAADGVLLGSPYSWSFTVIQPPAFAVSSRSPSAGATGVQRDVRVTVVFTAPADATTVNGTTFVLRGADGSPVAASVGYDAGTRTATLTPSAALAANATYTADVSGVRAADGTPISGSSVWTFTTADCPCSLFSPTAAPATSGNPTRDGRRGTGPWSYEFGVKITVNRTSTLTAVRFFKDAREVGSHTGTVWSAAGAILGTVAFSGESASGWQQATLTTPLTLQPGVVYVVSVNANAFFGSTRQGLLTSVVSGPLASVADGANGTYGDAAGVFPTRSFQSSNYFVDAVVR